MGPVIGLPRRCRGGIAPRDGMEAERHAIHKRWIRKATQRYDWPFAVPFVVMPTMGFVTLTVFFGLFCELSNSQGWTPAVCEKFFRMFGTAHAGLAIWTALQYPALGKREGTSQIGCLTMAMLLNLACIVYWDNFVQYARFIFAS